MRGKEDAGKRILQLEGITPAYAGKRGKGWQAGNSTQDHPRLCGEKSGDEFAVQIFARITPAYAGKRMRSAGTKRRYEDHPRLCGEKRQWQTARQTEAGSPPPMRGKD